MQKASLLLVVKKCLKRRLGSGRKASMFTEVGKDPEEETASKLYGGTSA